MGSVVRVSVTPIIINLKKVVFVGIHSDGRAK